MAEYPNLQLLEYIFRQAVVQLDIKPPHSIDAYVFPQDWPNTGGGFAEPGYVYGQAFTKEYTTVMFCGSLAFVAFGNKPAYVINYPNEAFMNDFNAKNMKSKHDSESAYKE